MNPVNISRHKSHDRKPLKLLLEIILNRRKVVYDVSERMNDLNSTFSSLNSSTATIEGSVDLSPQKNLNSNTKTYNKKKPKTIKVEIKLDISDASDRNDDDLSKDNKTFDDGHSIELQSTTIKRMSSRVSLSQQGGTVVNETQEEICSTSTLKRISSKISLAIKDDNKEIENSEETLFFDVLSSSGHENPDKLNSTSDMIYSELDSSHNNSFWNRLFVKLQSSYDASLNDKKIAEVIHALIMEKYKQALIIIKQRMEKREWKHNRSGDTVLNDLDKEKENCPKELDNKNEKPETKNMNPSSNLLDISRIHPKTAFETFEEKNKGVGIGTENSNTNNLTSEQYSKECKSSTSEDFIHFEHDDKQDKHDHFKRESVNSFLKSEGSSMYEGINQILQPETGSAPSKDKDIVKYDSQKFLRAALGDNMISSCESQIGYETCLYDTPTLDSPSSLQTEQSIGSSNLSVLLSESDRKSAGVSSLYSSVNKNLKKKYRNKGKALAKSTKSSNNDYGYESLDDLDIKEKNLMMDNIRQDEIIRQISKAVTVCRSYPQFFECGVLAEAEKILLVSNLKREIFNNELKKVGYEDIDTMLSSSSVNIKNIELYCKSNTTLGESKNKYSHFYVCVIRQGSTMHATKTLLQKGKVLKFPDEFHFDNMPSDFEMLVSIYGLTLKDKKNKKSKFKSCSELKTVPSISSNSMRSFFFLCGTLMIKPSQSSQTTFDLLKVHPDGPIKNVLKANIETTFKIHIKECGFLTIGVDYKGHPVWNRRWCLLNGSRLRYWNYPNEEEHCDPLGELDLLNCASYIIHRAEKDICPTPRTLMVLINHYENGVTSQKRYFLAADNLKDFEKWQEKINLVLNYLRKWSSLDCFLDN